MYPANRHSAEYAKRRIPKRMRLYDVLNQIRLLQLDRYTTVVRNRAQISYATLAFDN